MQCNISNVLKAQGKLPEVLTMLHDARAIFEKTLGQDHLQVADTKHKCARPFSPLDSNFDSTNAAFLLNHFCSIAVILRAQEKYGHAIRLCCENLAVYENCYGQDHARVLGTKCFITDLQKQHAASIDLTAGVHVRISGLISRPGLNGQQGAVLLFDREKARYRVRLAAGKEVLLKPECLTRISLAQAGHD